MKLCDFKKVFRSLDGHQSVRIWVLIIGGLQVGFWLYPPSTRIRSATEWNGSLWRLATGILVMFVWPPLQFAAKNDILSLTADFRWNFDEYGIVRRNHTRIC
jgi:hypothetical protein